MSLAPIAQRLSSASFFPQGNSKSQGGLGARSTFRYMVAGDARVLTHYIAVFFGTSPPFFSQKTQRRVFFFNLFSKPYVKLDSPRSNNQNIQRNKAILNQRHGSSLAHKWYLWLFAASITIHRGVRGNLIGVR
jgi:hypothetical protein